ncbi:hypothetical protein [Belnapia moabensis]|uniref:hypothetical protein n=1 Tax=Belnapia moabensis TaxID=365533 RepID=UPI0012EDCB13|nr:hypothetical protein [Belnapia moabensis]
MADETLIHDDANRVVIRLQGENASLTVGANGHAGQLIVRSVSGDQVLRFLAAGAVLTLGSEGNAGDIRVKDANGRDVFRLNGEDAILTVGANGNEGDLRIRDANGRVVFRFNGSDSMLTLGASGNEGDLRIKDSNGRDVLRFNALNAMLHLGAEGNEGDLRVRNQNGDEVIRLNGGAGDIVLNNADAAELFDLAHPLVPVPGTLMALDAQGKLIPASTPYDRKVVGVVAGAGEFRPGIILGNKGDNSQRVPISVVGKVSCKADASFGRIGMGDLLTTSSNPGHAMLVRNHHRACGSIIGKALTSLSEGTGDVNVLIGLQ